MSPDFNWPLFLTIVAWLLTVPLISDWAEKWFLDPANNTGMSKAEAQWISVLVGFIMPLLLIAVLCKRLLNLGRTAK